MNYNNIIYQLLSSSTDITAAVGSRIYPVTIAQNKDYPAVAFTKRIEPVNTKGMSNKIEDVMVNMYCVSDDLDQADTIAQMIRSVLDRYSQGVITEIKVSSITFVGQDHEQYDQELNVYLVPLTYKIRIII